MKTFSELAECLARIPPKITLYGLLFKYNYVGCLLLLMFSIGLLFAIKRDAYIFKETGWFCRFPKHQKLDKWAMAGEKGKHVGPNFTLKPNTKASSLQFCKTEVKTDIGGTKFGPTCLPLFSSHRPLVELLRLRQPTKSSCFLEDIRVPFDCKQQISTKHKKKKTSHVIVFKKTSIQSYFRWNPC